MRRLAVAIFVVALPAMAQAGPWGMGRGHFYVKLSTQRLSSTTLAAPDGTSFTIPHFAKEELSVFGAYGITDRFTAFATAPLVRSSNLDDQPDELGRETGFGDLQGGLQLQLGQSGAWVFAVRGTLQAPTGDESRAQGLLPTGSGVWEGEVVLGAGRSFAGAKGYGFVEVGPQFRGGGLRDGIAFGGQVGWNATRHFVLAANLKGVEPFSHEPPRVARGSFVGVGDRVTYVAYGPTLIVKFTERVALQLDVEGVFRARNLATGTVVRVGLAVSR